ncbi:NAD(P)/FAD-dependent oxidoreductase [Corynebacterium epidermidicanis]|uniref:Glycine/D-amino acid oxidase, deaminating n=1 Tax=Corynebacterium epidermidicanis TaxID=1050174 RepID=A0A0G3GRA6_9CORY|nr:FAD-binding oxidoreductase [Corynebacterium epidermidicanis]AKK03716.1 glycine/D-amino acid oxidase, deaminating [Corynebacterium epidermidicanis]
MQGEPVSLELTYANHQPDIANVVIVGGGIMGMATAWTLAHNGVTGIVVIEQSELGSGSSAKPLGGVRANFSDPANIVLGKRSLAAYETFADDFGVDIQLSKVGYLFVARTEGELESLKACAKAQQELGVDCRIITAAEAVRLNPLLSPTHITGAIFSPNDGHVKPSKVVEGYARACQELGVTILNHTQVLNIAVVDNAIDSVTTNRGTIHAPRVICAAGAWSQRIGEMVGQHLPVTAVRRLIGITPPIDGGHPTIPFTIDLGSTMYFHNYGEGLLVGVSHPEEPSLCREFCYDWVQQFSETAELIAPSLANPALSGGWGGFYENTPDHNAMIGASESVQGFYYITGFSGHGLLQAPAAAELLTDIYLGRESFMDPAVWSANRFADLDRLVQEVNII